MVRPDLPACRLWNYGWLRFLVVDAGAADPSGMGKMFQDPSLFAKLAANPKTAPLLADPSFMQKVRSGRPVFALSMEWG